MASKAKEYSIKSQEQNEKSHFIFKNEAETLDFEFESDKRVKCPRCKIAYKNIVCHLQKSRCKISNIKLLTERFQEFKKNMFAEDIRQKQNEWKKKSLAKKREENSQKLKDDLNKRESKYLAKQREEDPEKFKADQNQRKAKSRNKKREEDFQKVKQEQNKWKGKSLNKKREEDFQKVKEDQNKRKEKSLIKKREEDFQKVKDDQNERKRISLNKKREEDFQKVKDDQNKRKKLSRNKRKIEDAKGLAKYENQVKLKRKKLWNASDRLKEFKETTKYNAIFICSCCHRRLFNTNVEIITPNLRAKIDGKKAGHFRACVEEDIVTPINGRNDAYLCKTCINHMMQQKTPPMAAVNGLMLYPQSHDMQLTELEGALISKNLIFQKIYQLPKSR